MYLTNKNRFRQKRNITNIFPKCTILHFWLLLLNFIVCHRIYTFRTFSSRFGTGVEATLVEINLIKGKWLIGCLFNPHKSKIKILLKKIKLVLINFHLSMKTFF